MMGWGKEDTVAGCKPEALYLVDHKQEYTQTKQNSTLTFPTWVRGRRMQEKKQIT